MRILVADKLAEEGLEFLKQSGAEFDVRVGLKEDELAAAVPGYDALIVRSGAKVTAKVLANPGKLKAIATTYDTRISADKSIPTTKEAGYAGVKIGHWAGLFAPKDTPKAIVHKMSEELLAAVKSREFADKLVPQGIEPAPYSMQAYLAFINAERERLGKIARTAKMQAD